jgi:hypothetical protein
MYQHYSLYRAGGYYRSIVFHAPETSGIPEAFHDH